MIIPNTDVAVLSKIIASGPVDAALPRNLSDEILLQIARDLRVIELSATVDEGIVPPLAGPMYLIAKLMQAHGAKPTEGKATVQLRRDRLEHWIRRYMVFIEREIVSRAVKVPHPWDSDLLMSEIREEVLDIQANYPKG